MPLMVDAFEVISRRLICCGGQRSPSLSSTLRRRVGHFPGRGRLVCWIANRSARQPLGPLLRATFRDTV
jgi:hypothetical protein